MPLVVVLVGGSIAITALGKLMGARIESKTFASRIVYEVALLCWGALIYHFVIG